MPVRSGPGIRGLIGIALPACLVLLAAASWAAPPQDMGECDVPHFDSMRWNTVTTMTGENRILNFTKPTIRCPGGTTIRSDSVRVYEATQYYQLYGNVEFVDPESRLTSDQAQYFSEQRRLTTAGNSVLVNLVDGSIVTGHTMTLIRAREEGDEESLTVQGGQPHATLYPTVQEVEEVPEPVGVPPDSMMAEPDPGDAAQGSAGVVLDTLPSTPTDTTVAAMDSTVVATDATVTAMDSTVVAEPLDSAAAIPDTIAALPDTAAAALPDTTEAPPDTATALPDTVSVEPDPEPLERGGSEQAADPQALAEELPTEPETPAGLDVEEEPAERVPYEIDARRFVLQGSEYFRAVGNVVVTRDSLTATADSLEYEKAQGALFLSRNASVKTADYDLAADDIRLAIPQDEIREARAMGDAVLEGKEIQLVSPILTLFFSDGLLERLVAVRDHVADSIRAEMDDIAREQDRLRRGVPPLSVRALGFSEFPNRPYALAENFALEGDSVEVMAPGEVIEEVRAFGAARGESLGQDSLNTEETPDLISRDWLEGDTITALFAEKADSSSGQALDETDTAGDPEAPPPDLEREGQEPDSAGAGYILKQLVAAGNARSMYRMAPSDSLAAEEPGVFAVHYVVGDVITILLNETGEAEHMEVAGQTRGIHLEPLSQGQNMVDSTAVPDTAALGLGARGLIIDTTVTVPDTTVVDPDTSVVVPRGPWARRSSWVPDWMGAERIIGPRGGGTGGGLGG